MAHPNRRPRALSDSELTHQLTALILEILLGAIPFEDRRGDRLHDLAEEYHRRYLRRPVDGCSCEECLVNLHEDGTLPLPFH